MIIKDKNARCQFVTTVTDKEGAKRCLDRASIVTPDAPGESAMVLCPKHAKLIRDSLTKDLKAIPA